MLHTYIGSVDYDSGPYMVTIPAGMREASFNISITNDIILEGNENFSLVLLSSSLPVVFADEAVVTIVDDDGNLNFKDEHHTLIK